MAYLLDANVFIQAKNLHYGLDFCPAFWEWLIARNKSGDVLSIEKVGDEIAAGGDKLSEWAEPLGSSFFIPPDEATLAAFTMVSNWAKSQKYEEAAINTFLQVADYYLVAQALAGKHVVVTHEKPDPNRKWKIKIPDACIGLKIKCITPFEMLRIERARFVLGPQK